MVNPSTNLQNVFNMTLSGKGPIVVPQFLDFSTATEVEVDLSPLVQNNNIDFISGAWIDNADSSEDMTIRVDGTRQRIIIGAGQQGYMPLLSPNNPKFVVSYAVSPGTFIPMFFYNIPLLPMLYTRGGMAVSGDWLTDAELRASPVPVDIGAVGALDVNVISPDPLPVSAVSLPLPTGAATEATLAAASAKLPSSLGAKTGALSFSVVPNTDTSFPVTQLTASDFNAQIVGNVAGATADAGNPVKVGAVYNTALPIYTNGQRSELQTGSRGSLNVTVFSANGTGSLSLVTPADAQSPSSNLQVGGFGMLFNGSNWDRWRGDVNGANTQLAITGSRWQYAAASGGIVNTTVAVTIAAAAGGSLRNYITGLEIDAGTLGAATEIAIRDGAGGTVIWRGFIGTGGITRTVTFPVPLKGSANTLLEVVTLTASVTGAVYVNAQGYIAL